MPAPHAAGRPARNIADVKFLSLRLGFLVSYKGQFDREPARIQRTVDGGRTWRDVWRAPGARLDWIAFADRRHGFAGGDGFIVRTSDGGVSWTRSQMTLPPSARNSLGPLEPQFLTPRAGFAVTDPSSFGRQVFLRTLDGGRQWQAVRAPRLVGDLDFISPRVGFATSSAGGPCRALYRTEDGGSSWRSVKTPCVPYPLVAVDFVDARHGFLGGGNPADTETGPSQAVFATADGGRTWQRRFVNPHRGYSQSGGLPFVRFQFVDARLGWGTTGLCKCCPSGPCAGDVYVTRDGGRSWRRRGSEVRFTAVGSRAAWVVPHCDEDCDLLWRTTDAGRTWRPIARPDRVNLSTARGEGRFVALGSFDGAAFVSRDRGRTWRFDPTRGDNPVRVRRPGLSVEDAAQGLLVNGRRVRVPLREVTIADFRDAAHGLVAGPTSYQETCVRYVYEYPGRRMLRTGDGGRTWQRVKAPFEAVALSSGGRLTVALGVHRCRLVLAISHDDGRSWRIRRLPTQCVPSVGAAESVWLSCGRFLYHGGAGGTTWVRSRAPRSTIDVAAINAGEAWAVAGEGGFVAGRNRLWHTVDGGRIWTEVWPSLPTRGMERP